MIVFIILVVAVVFLWQIHGELYKIRQLLEKQTEKRDHD